MPKLSKVRAMAQPFIPALAREEESARKAYQRLREMGLGYRWQDFLTDWREEKDVPKKADYLKNVPRKYAFTDAVTTEKEWYMSRKYAVVFKVTGTDLATGEKGQERFYTIATDERRSIGLLTDTMRSLLEQKRFEYTFAFDKVELEVIWRRAEHIPAPWGEE